MRLHLLHGVVIAEHDCLWSREEINALNDTLHPFKAFRGVEISSANGHFVVIGLNHLDGVQPGIPAAELLDRIKGQGAAMILAHHHLQYAQMRQPLDIAMMPDGIHAIEVASTATSGKNQEEAIQIAERRGWCQVAGSDAHAIESVGAAFTAFTQMPDDEQTLAAAIRNGTGIPMRSRLEHRQCFSVHA